MGFHVLKNMTSKAICIPEHSSIYFTYSACTDYREVYLSGYCGEQHIQILKDQYNGAPQQSLSQPLHPSQVD